LCVCSAESAKSRQLDSVATVGDTDVKVGRCVVWTEMQVEFEDGCGRTRDCRDPVADGKTLAQEVS